MPSLAVIGPLLGVILGGGLLTAVVSARKVKPDIAGTEIKTARELNDMLRQTLLSEREEHRAQLERYETRIDELLASVEALTRERDSFT